MSYFESYGLTGLASLTMDLIRTRLFFRGARLIRFPIFIRGRKWINFGSHFSSGRSLRIEAYGEPGSAKTLIHIGNNVRVNDYVHIGANHSITIGDRVLIASKVFIADHNHGEYGKGETHSDPHVPPADRTLSSAAIVIEQDVWIGELVAVLPGVRIGKGSIIGALSTVTKDIPPYSIAVGSPARVIKQYNLDTARWESL